MDGSCKSVCVCGKNLNVEHDLTCPTGGLPMLRHNDIRDLTADLMAEVCNNVCMEPELQPLIFLAGEALQGRSANCPEPRVSWNGHKVHFLM